MSIFILTDLGWRTCSYRETMGSTVQPSRERSVQRRWQVTPTDIFHFSFPLVVPIIFQYPSAYVRTRNCSACNRIDVSAFLLFTSIFLLLTYESSPPYCFFPSLVVCFDFISICNSKAQKAIVVLIKEKFHFVCCLSSMGALDCSFDFVGKQSTKYM